MFKNLVIDNDGSASCTFSNVANDIEGVTIVERGVIREVKVSRRVG